MRPLVEGLSRVPPVVPDALTSISRMPKNKQRNLAMLGGGLPITLTQAD